MTFLGQYGYPYRRRFWPAVGDAARQLGTELAGLVRVAFGRQPIGVGKRLESLATVYIMGLMLSMYLAVFVGLPVALLVWMIRSLF